MTSCTGFTPKLSRPENWPLAEPSSGPIPRSRKKSPPPLASHLAMVKICPDPN